MASSKSRRDNLSTLHAIERLESRTLLASVGQQPSGALTGKIVYTVGGHGITADYPGTGAWATQRGNNNQLVEDFGNQDQMTWYVNYLFNAGATVVPLRPVGRQPNEVVVDNGQATFTGTWTNGASTPYFGTAADAVKYRSATSSVTETATAKYTPNIPAAGIYPVYAWALDGANRLPDQVYRVTYSGGVTEVKVNHQRVGKGWVYLGSYYFDKGTSGYVQVSNRSATAGNAIADAIRFGNGMGDINRGAGVSGYSREEEPALYWIMKMAGVGTPQSAYYGTNSSDRDATVSAAPRYAAYMNNQAIGAMSDRLFLSFHSNAGGGTARGTLGLYNGNNNPATATPNQKDWATLVATEVRNDLVGLGSKVEFPWANNSSVVLDRSDIEFGEINNLTIGNEFDATIVEVGYHDNAQDAADMLDPKVRNWAARASYQASVKYFNKYVGTPVNLLPDQPANVRAVADTTGGITLSWTPPVVDAIGGQAPSGYTVYTSTNGYGFDAGRKVTGGVTSSLRITGLSTGQVYYFRVAATNAGGESLPGDVVASRPRSGGAKQVLIVNGYDRLDRTQDYAQVGALTTGGAVTTSSRARYRYNNTRDYSAIVGEAIEAFGNVAVDTAQNESITGGQVKLTDYKYVIWLSGEESVKDETFSAAEQSAVSSYLAANGKLFVTGSELGFDLVGNNKGVSFFNNTLHAGYAADDANTYTASGAAGSIFSGISLTFDNGKGDMYGVDSPDKLSASSGSTIAMSYTGAGSGGAAVQYSTAAGQRVVVMGFPFESITTAANRNAVMKSVLNFFGAGAPSTPTGLTLSGGSSIKLDWNDNSGTPVAGYNVYRASSSAGPYAKINSSLVAASAYTDATATAGKTWYYRVSGVTSSQVESAQGATVSGKVSTLMMDVGSTGYTDSRGNKWTAEAGVTGGAKSTASFAVANTTDDSLYYTRRIGKSFSYAIGVANGTYQLKLYFADPSYTTAGKRKFNVTAEGKMILTNFDIVANGGGKAAIVKTFSVTITDGKLNLAFAATLDNAVLSAIELV
jgi:hypothetical protein